MKFSEHSSEEQEKMAKHNISLLDKGGMSEAYDATWVAKQLCTWAVDLIKEGKALPPSLGEWLVGGIISATNGGSFKRALTLKKESGGQYKLDENVQIKFKAASLVVNEGMKMEDVIMTLAEETCKSEGAIHSIVYSKEGWDFQTVKKAISQCD